MGFRRARAAETAGLAARRVSIRLGGETAVVVPVHEYRTLKVLRDRASAGQVEEAEIDAAIAEHEAWKAAGSSRIRPTHGPRIAADGLRNRCPADRG